MLKKIKLMTRKNQEKLHKWQTWLVVIFLGTEPEKANCCSISRPRPKTQLLFFYISLYDSSPHASLKPNLTPKTIKKKKKKPS